MRFLLPNNQDPKPTLNEVLDAMNWVALKGFQILFLLTLLMGIKANADTSTDFKNCLIDELCAMDKGNRKQSLTTATAACETRLKVVVPVELQDMSAEIANKAPNTIVFKVDGASYIGICDRDFEGSSKVPCEDVTSVQEAVRQNPALCDMVANAPEAKPAEDGVCNPYNNDAFELVEGVCVYKCDDDQVYVEDNQLANPRYKQGKVCAYCSELADVQNHQGQEYIVDEKMFNRCISKQTNCIPGYPLKKTPSGEDKCVPPCDGKLTVDVNYGFWKCEPSDKCQNCREANQQLQKWNLSPSQFLPVGNLDAQEVYQRYLKFKSTEQSHNDLGLKECKVKQAYCGTGSFWQRLQLNNKGALQDLPDWYVYFLMGPYYGKHFSYPENNSLLEGR